MITRKALGKTNDMLYELLKDVEKAEEVISKMTSKKFRKEAITKEIPLDELNCFQKFILKTLFQRITIKIHCLTARIDGLRGA